MTIEHMAEGTPGPGTEGPQPVERPQRQPSEFEETLNQLQQNSTYIAALENHSSSPDRDQLLKLARERKDNLEVDKNRLLNEANEQGLFNSLKKELSGVYYSSRVKITSSEKEGRDEYQGRGKLQELSERQQEALTSLEADGTAARTDSLGRRTEHRIINFWTDPQHPERRTLEQTYRGTIDYFNQQSLAIIHEVVRDRKRYTSSSDPYPDTGITGIWNGPVTDSAGHIIKDEEAKEVGALDFNDVRAAIEEARRQEPWVPNRMDYETYIRFVADDVEELEEMIPYIVAKVTRKLGTGQPDKLSETLEGEKRKLDGALANFPVESERQFRRLKSTLSDNLNLMGAYFFSDKVQDDWQPYLAYMNMLATGTEDTEQQDHLVDALILDRDGLTMLACQQFSKDDGIFWRYGEKGANLGKESDPSKFSQWQVRRRNEINGFLMTRKLKEMKTLLGFTVDGKDNIIRYGNPTHPAFQRLKQKFDALDQDDQDNWGFIRDIDGKLTGEPRWWEYCKKALAWEKIGRFGDPRDAERVTFQHPLARSFKPSTKDASGEIRGEFPDMFEEDKQKDTDRWYESTKRRKVKRIIEKAERISRAFMLDSAAALAWHVVKPLNEKLTGEDLDKDKARVKKEIEEINGYLKDAGEDPIAVDDSDPDNPIPLGSVPQKTLFRALMQACIKEDKTKLPQHRNFKMYDLLTERLGIDIDIPTFASWYLGWHDTLRPAVILPTIKNDDRPGGLGEAMPAPGKDEKNTGTSWAERERRIRLLMQMVMKAKFGRSGSYFNYPGHDTRGAGVKDVRNYLNLMYGTSRDTSWLNDLLDGAIPLEQEFTGDHGLTRDPITQYVGMTKGGDEVIFAKSGYAGLIENPRDFKAWVKRTNANVENSKRYTSGDKEGYALMNDGPLAGGYLWRDYNLDPSDNKYTRKNHPKMFATDAPNEAIKDMSESTYRAGIDLASRTIKPLITVMQNTIDSTQGKNPGSARFANTLLWYAVSKWMDTSWEFRQKPGYAVDANLHTARYFMHQYILEYGQGGLIYTDEEFDEIMLGTVIKADGIKVVRYETDSDGNTKDDNGNIIYRNPDSVGNIRNVKGDIVYKVDQQREIQDLQGNIVDKKKVVLAEIQEGLIDAFPKELRKEILEGKDLPIKDGNGNEIRDKNRKVRTYKDYILPFGLKSKFPETMANFYREKDSVQKDYEGSLKSQIKSREKVSRL